MSEQKIKRTINTTVKHAMSNRLKLSYSILNKYNLVYRFAKGFGYPCSINSQPPNLNTKYAVTIMKAQQQESIKH